MQLNRSKNELCCGVYRAVSVFSLVAAPVYSPLSSVWRRSEPFLKYVGTFSSCLYASTASRASLFSFKPLTCKNLVNWAVNGARALRTIQDRWKLSREVILHYLPSIWHVFESWVEMFTRGQRSTCVVCLPISWCQAHSCKYWSVIPYWNRPVCLEISDLFWYGRSSTNFRFCQFLIEIKICFSKQKIYQTFDHD